MTNFPQFKKLSIYDDYEPSKVSNSTGTIPNNNYHKQIGKTMSEMTTSEAIEVLKAYSKWLNNTDMPDGSHIVRSDMPNMAKFPEALDKAIKVMGSRDEYINTIRDRQLKILSEPDGIVRETMINNLLIGLE